MKHDVRDLVIVTTGAPTSDGGRDFIAPGYTAFADGRILRALERNLNVGEKVLAEIVEGPHAPRGRAEPDELVPFRLVCQQLFTQAIRFPEVYWSEDPEPGVDEAEEVLGRLR